MYNTTSYKQGLQTIAGTKCSFTNIRYVIVYGKFGKAIAVLKCACAYYRNIVAYWHSDKAVTIIKYANS